MIFYSCNHTSRESNGPMLRVKIQTFRLNPGPSSVNNDLAGQGDFMRAKRREKGLKRHEGHLH